jgi:phage terminase large subunit-like protein
LRFPNSKHDDIIDSLSWAVKLLDVNTWNSDLEYSQALSFYLED